MQDELSKLCTNISKSHFDLATSAWAGLDVQKMELSLQYAEKSVKLNPYWIKGYYRISEAKQILGEKWNIPNLNQKKLDFSKIKGAFSIHIRGPYKQWNKTSITFDQKRFMLILISAV